MKRRHLRENQVVKRGKKQKTSEQKVLNCFEKLRGGQELEDLVRAVGQRGS